MYMVLCITLYINKLIYVYIYICIYIYGERVAHIYIYIHIYLLLPLASEGSTAASPVHADAYCQPRCQDTELAKNTGGVSENYVYRPNASEIGEAWSTGRTGY